jgi:hypothetical protein
MCTTPHIDSFAKKRAFTLYFVEITGTKRLNHSREIQLTEPLFHGFVEAS